MNMGVEGVTLFSYPPSTPDTFYERRIETVYTPEATDDGGVAAPWWERASIERLGSVEGNPLPRGFVDGYEELFTALSDLLDEEGFDPKALEAAVQALQRGMFAGAAPPRMSWHGKDAIVFFWSLGTRTSFFTITACDVSFLQEADGCIVDRRDDLHASIWNMIFPLPTGRH